MNAKKCKALREQVGFVPSAKRSYKKLKRNFEVQLIAKGKRLLYQQVKRGRITL